MNSAPETKHLKQPGSGTERTLVTRTRPTAELDRRHRNRNLGALRPSKGGYSQSHRRCMWAAEPTAKTIATMLIHDALCWKERKIRRRITKGAFILTT